MDQKTHSRLLAGAGIFCFILAFVLLTSFKGQFGKDTAGKSSVPPMMEDTVDVTPSKNSAADDAPKQIASTSSESAAPDAKWVVYVTGAVKKPGVYEVAPGSRAYEALKAAGGFTANADQESVNLAAKLQDGQQLKFLKKGETAQQNAAAVSSSGASSSGASSRVQAPSAAQSSSGRVNINTASQSELETIKGVGPKTAQAIMDYRAKNGAFSRIEDIMNVKGIGEKKFDSMRDQISTGN